MTESYATARQLDLGEAVHILAEVKPSCGSDADFTITSAEYELRDENGNVESEGSCAIDKHELDIFVSPKRTGTYTLRYTYTILDETWIDTVLLKVR